MNAYEPYISFLCAGGVGLLVGLERERAQLEDAEIPLPAGARTHTIVALLGACSMFVETVGPWMVVGGLASITVLLGLSYWDTVRRGGDPGLTSEVALLLAYVFGAMCLTEELFPSTEAKLITVWALAVTTTVLLSTKRKIHGLVGRLSKADVNATLKFLITVVIVLPLLPNRTYGPLDVLNPFHVGVMIVLIAGMEFAGYVAVRILGPNRGLGLTGLLGGLASSTAVTLSMAARAKEEPTVSRACALAVVVASTIMLVRVVLEVAIVYRPLLSALLIPFGAMTVTGLVVCAVLYSRSRDGDARAEEIKFTNPFELASAVKFGLLFAGVLMASKAASTYLGETGTYLAGFVSGLADVDAITLSMAKLAEEGLTHRVAATTILIASVSNTLVKAGIASVLGGWKFGRVVLLSMVAVAAAGGVGVAALWMSG